MAALFTWRTARWIGLALILLAVGAWGWRWRSKRLLTRELTEYAILLQRAYEASATSAPTGVPCTDRPAEFLDRFTIHWNGTLLRPVKFQRIRLEQVSLQHTDGSIEQVLKLYPDATYGVGFHIFGFPIPSYYTGRYFGFRKVDGRWCFDEASFTMDD